MFLHKETVTEIFRPKLNFTEKKQQNRVLCHPLVLLVLIELFWPYLAVEVL